MRAFLLPAIVALAAPACAPLPDSPGHAPVGSSGEAAAAHPRLPAGLDNPQRFPPRPDDRAILAPIPTTPEGQPRPTPIPPADPSDEPRTGPITPR